MFRLNTCSVRLRRAASAAALMLTAATVGAQGYRDRPISLIVPFSAGGDADLAARNLVAAAQEILGQNRVVMNRAGAGGAVGSNAARTVVADGYTFMMGRVGSQAVLPALQNPRPSPMERFQHDRRA